MQKEVIIDNHQHEKRLLQSAVEPLGQNSVEHLFLLSHYLCFEDRRVINFSFTLSDSHEWDIPDWEGLLARYEHCSFIPESDPETLWVFAGAEQSGNRNCVQVLHTTGN